MQRLCTCLGANVRLQGSNFVRQHLKLASQINRHHCYLWRLGWNLTSSQTGITAKPCWILAIFFFFFPPSESPPNLLMWNHAGLDWHRTKKFCCCHLKLEFEKKNKKQSWMLVALHHCVQKHWSSLTLQTLFRSIKSYNKQPLTQAETIKTEAEWAPICRE